MNALLINVPLTGLGSSASAHADSATPGNGEASFADALAATMAGAMQTAAMPDQHSPANPIGMPEGYLGASPKVADDQTAAKPALRVDGVLPIGAGELQGGLEAQSSQERLSPKNMLGEAAPPLKHSGIETGVNVDGGVAEVTLGSSAKREDIGQNELGRQSSSVPATPATISRKLQLGDQAPVGASTHNQNENGKSETPGAPTSQPPAAIAGTEGSAIAVREHDPLHVDQVAKPPVAGAERPFVPNANDQRQTFSRNRFIGAGDPVASTDNGESLAARPSAPGLFAQRSGQPLPVEAPPPLSVDPSKGQPSMETGQPRLGREADIPPKAGAASEAQGVVRFLGTEPDNVHLEAAFKQSEPIRPVSNAATMPAVLQGMSQQTDQPRPLINMPRDQRPQRLPASSGEIGQKPMTPFLQTSGTASAPAGEVNPIEGVDLAKSGFDRFSAVLSTEGVLHKGEPFEPAISTIGSARSLASSNPTAPGAQLGVQIARSLANGVERLTVHLQPAELGSVDIQLSFEGAGKLSAQIVAERPETLELLQRDSRLLERSLGDSGLKLSNDGLSFSLKQDQQQHQHGQGFQDQPREWLERSEAHRSYGKAQDDEGAPSQVQLGTLRLLDIQT